MRDAVVCSAILNHGSRVDCRGVGTQRSSTEEQGGLACSLGQPLPGRAPVHLRSFVPPGVKSARGRVILDGELVLLSSGRCTDAFYVVIVLDFCEVNKNVY